MLTQSEFLGYVRKISIVTSKQGRVYKFKLNDNDLYGEGLGDVTSRPRAPFKLSVDALYRAYQNGVETTTEMKKYANGRQSPALAVLMEVRKMLAEGSR